jgi:nicotinamide-nucleotide amidase
MAELKARAQEILKLARERRMTLATVESCTAGTLANLLSQGEGASEALHGGFIVYTKENKTQAVGVPRDLLDKHTAVSAEVAEAMAVGGLKRWPATIVAAITGVAGPEPDEDGNPVGLVHVAAAARDGRVRVSRHEFDPSDKDKICGSAIEQTLDLLDDMLRAHVP